MTGRISNIRTKDHAHQGRPMPLAELIFVLFAILAIATPFIPLVLLGKYKKLRDNLDQLAEENSRQHASFQHEVADLKRQLTAATYATPAAGEPVHRPVAPVAPAVKEAPAPTQRADLPAQLKLPPPLSLPPSDNT